MMKKKRALMMFLKTEEEIEKLLKMEVQSAMVMKNLEISDQKARA